jgi:adenine-specific DNA methylase
MTKKLETLLNIEEKAPLKIKSNEETQAEVASIQQSYNEITEMAKGLPRIRELENLGERELEKLAKKAEAAYDDLMDLGMNVEVRYASRIFEVASSMLGHSISANTAKIDKKLKAVDMQLKKLKMENRAPDDDMIDGTAYVTLDRNELMSKLSGKS